MQQHSVSRRKATPEDLPFLLQLRRETMAAHLAASGVAQSDDEHLQRVLTHFEVAEILIRNTDRVGLLKVVREGLHWELLQVQLHPFLQGQGLGTALLKQLISEAQDANAALRLSVLRANPARSLYERLGFTVVSQKAHSFEMLRAPLKKLLPSD